jgi:hypothetical protein
VSDSKDLVPKRDSIPILPAFTVESDLGFLSILSIKHGNWFYWADRAEAAERAESKESPVFMRI